MFTVQNTSVAHHRRDRVLDDQLFLAVVLQEHGVLVEGADLTGELDAADQVYRYRGLVLANRIQECVLNILCRLGFHALPISSCASEQRCYELPQTKPANDNAALSGEYQGLHP